MMRLGIFGGTFDPIHLGHLILAEQAREACALDRLLLVVTGAPPHKLGERTAVGHRLEMARIAVAGNPGLEVSDIEAIRPGPHYSVETLEQLTRIHPDAELFFLIGADTLFELPGWREPDRIAQLARIVVINRPGYDAIDPEQVPTLSASARGFQFVTVPPIGIASSDIRERASRGRSIRYLVPRAVEAYIDAHRLYRQS